MDAFFFKRQKILNQNIAHEKSSQRPYFDRLTECWIRVLLDVHSGLN